MEPNNFRLKIFLSTTKETIYEATLSFYYFFRIVGYASYTIKDTYILTPLDSIEVRWIDIVTFLFFLIYNIIVFRSSFDFNPKDKENDSVINIFGLKLMLWLALVNTVIGTTLSFLLRTAMIRTLKHFHSVDLKLRQIGRPLNLTYYFRMVLIVNGTFMCILSFMVYMQHRHLVFTFREFFYVFIPNGNYLILMSSYVAFIKSVQIRLVQIRKGFDLVVEQDDQSTFTESICLIGEMYGGIYQASVYLRKYLGLPVMLSLLLSYTYIIFSAFATYRIIKNDALDTQNHHIVLYVLWSIVYFSVVFLFALIGSGVRSQLYQFMMKIIMTRNMIQNGVHKNRVFVKFLP